MNICGWEGLSMSTRWLGMLLGLPHLEVTSWGGIYSHQPNVAVGEGCWRWAHRTVRCATGQCPVRRHVILPLGLGAGQPLEALSSCCTGQSSGTPDSPVSLWLAALTSEFHCSLCRVDRCAQIAVAPLVHRTVRWIIAELHLGNPKVKSSSWFTLVQRTLSGGAPDTVRWPTGLSGAPDQGILQFPFCSFLLRPNLFFWLVCVEPLAPVECIILNKLVSPIICVGQFNHQNQLGKGLTLFPFQSPPFWWLMPTQIKANI
jgi:hypothetical protein